MSNSTMTNQELEAKILEGARRYGLYAKVFAESYEVDVKRVRYAIRKLLNRNLIFANSRIRPNYWGGGPVEYRAVKE